MNYMIEGVEIKPLKKFNDERGWLSEIYRSDETDYRPEMTYFSATLPGVIRGPHEHRQQSDMFVFLIGTFRLYLWDNREGSSVYRILETMEVGEDNPCSVVIPPGVVHGYKCISDKPGYTINLPNRLYAGKGKTEEVDEIRWEADKDSPFVIE